MAVSGVGVAMAASGAFLAYAAITNQPPATALRDVLKGNIRPVPDKAPTGWTVAPAGGDPSKTTVSSPWVDAGGSLFASAALQYVGRPYQWAHNFDSPNGGGDCSGLVYRAFHDLGYNTPRLSSWQYPVWSAVTRDSTARPGDILWWSGHVAIAVGNGNMVEAPTVGVPVRVVKIRRGYLALTPQLAAVEKYKAPAGRGKAF